MRRRPLARAVSRWPVPALAAVLVAASLAGVAAGTDLGLITGAEGGIYYQFGQDLQRLLKAQGINLTVHPSNGAVDNIYAVSQRPGVQLAIVQSDLLAFVADQQANPTLARIAQGIRLVFPLYDEEVHILARREIGTLDALAGKRVAIGREGSGTYLTARLLFKLAGITPAELIASDGADALNRLKAGQLDAMVSVIAQPIGRFRTEVNADDGLALISITEPAIVQRYAVAKIPPATYSWQPTPVTTVATKAVLIAYDVRRRECESIGRLAQHVVAGLDWLVRNGHPQWKRVNLEQLIPGWEQYDCVRKYVRQPPAADNPAASTGERNPIADAIKDALER
jgi:uncharacterized protein